MQRGERDFRPPAGLRSPHTQSILATLDWRARWVERKSAGIRAVSRDVILECEDGTRIVAAHAPAPDPRTSRGTVTLLHGWEGSANSAYLGYSIAGDRLAGVRCATTILASEDDPIIPVDDFRELRVPESVEIDLQRWGGHCGFIENLRLESWADWRIGRILAEKP